MPAGCGSEGQREPAGPAGLDLPADRDFPGECGTAGRKRHRTGLAEIEERQVPPCLVPIEKDWTPIGAPEHVSCCEIAMNDAAPFAPDRRPGLAQRAPKLRRHPSQIDISPAGPVQKLDRGQEARALGKCRTFPMKDPYVVAQGGERARSGWSAQEKGFAGPACLNDPAAAAGKKPRNSETGALGSVVRGAKPGERGFGSPRRLEHEVQLQTVCAEYSVSVPAG